MMFTWSLVVVIFLLTSSCCRAQGNEGSLQCNPDGPQDCSFEERGISSWCNWTTDGGWGVYHYTNDPYIDEPSNNFAGVLNSKNHAILTSGLACSTNGEVNCLSFSYEIATNDVANLTVFVSRADDYQKTILRSYSSSSDWEPTIVPIVTDFDFRVGFEAFQHTNNVAGRSVYIHVDNITFYQWNPSCDFGGRNLCGWTSDGGWKWFSNKALELRPNTSALLSSQQSCSTQGQLNFQCLSFRYFCNVQDKIDLNVYVRNVENNSKQKIWFRSPHEIIGVWKIAYVPMVTYFSFVVEIEALRHPGSQSDDRVWIENIKYNRNSSCSERTPDTGVRPATPSMSSTQRHGTSTTLNEPITATDTLSSSSTETISMTKATASTVITTRESFGYIPTTKQSATTSMRSHGTGTTLNEAITGSPTTHTVLNTSTGALSTTRVTASMVTTTQASYSNTPTTKQSSPTGTHTQGPGTTVNNPITGLPAIRTLLGTSTSTLRMTKSTTSTVSTPQASTFGNKPRTQHIVSNSITEMISTSKAATSTDTTAAARAYHVHTSIKQSLTAGIHEFQKHAGEAEASKHIGPIVGGVFAAVVVVIVAVVFLLWGRHKFLWLKRNTHNPAEQNLEDHVTAGSTINENVPTSLSSQFINMTYDVDTHLTETSDFGAEHQQEDSATEHYSTIAELSLPNTDINLAGASASDDMPVGICPSGHLAVGRENVYSRLEPKFQDEDYSCLGQNCNDHDADDDPLEASGDNFLHLK